MGANPFVPQGNLNRLLSAIQFTNNPQLNITASFCAPEQLAVRFDGQPTLRLPTATGTVPSMEPKLDAVVTCHLIKSQPFCALWKTQLETNSLLGPAVLYPDTSGGISPWNLDNCSIVGMDPTSLNGSSPDYILMIGGIYYINNGLWP